MQIQILGLDSQNRMLRLGFGLNEGRAFFRVDFWFIGIRITGNRT
jgi:hypothetical protein